MMMSRAEMTFNSSSSPPPLPPSSSNSSHFLLELCWWDGASNTLFTSFLVFELLVLLPIFILVLYMGLCRWRKQRPAGHSDILTYHMVSIEIIGLAGCVLYSCGAYTRGAGVLKAGLYLFSVTTPGQTLFHVLTCMDRFLAVVYPVTYLSLKQGGGVRIRNVCTVCVWVCCLSGMAVIEEVLIRSSSILAFSFWLISLVFISFFSVSVLCVLIRPGPGDRKQANQSKRRAFNSIAGIMCALMMKCLGFLTACAILTLSELQPKVRCAVMMLFPWLSVPSSLVLPLMFLHRAGKLRLCKLHPESG